ncbi:MAG: hypothetical protein IKN92_03280 [Clostridia bacterium]|nr:hypothetical protein [Clostridia bacterium]
MKKAISIIIVIMFLMTVFSVGRNRVLAENETDPGQNEEPGGGGEDPSGGGEDPGGGGEDPGGGGEEDPPKLEEKLVLSVKSVTPASLVGEGTVTLNIEIKNEGDPVSDVVLSIDGAQVESFGNISKGASKTYNKEYAVAAEKLGQSIPVTVTYVFEGSTKTKTESFKVTKEKAKIDISSAVKTDKATIVAGETVKFTFAIENKGNCELTEATLLVPGLNGGESICPEFSLAAGNSKVITYSEEITETIKIEPTLKFTADGKKRSKDLAKTTVTVETIDVTVSATASNNYPKDEEPVEIKITITNNGNTSLYNLALTADGTVPVPVSSDALTSGSTIEAVYSVTQTVTGDHSFVLTCKDEGGDEHTFTSNIVTIYVEEKEPVDYSKDLSLKASADSSNLQKEGTIVFTIKVLNSGESQFTDLKLTEVRKGELDITTDRILGPGEKTYTYTLNEKISEDTTYNFTLTATDPEGNPVTISADPVKVEAPKKEKKFNMLVFLIILLILLLLAGGITILVMTLKDKNREEQEEMIEEEETPRPSRRHPVIEQESSHIERKQVRPEQSYAYMKEEAEEIPEEAEEAGEELEEQIEQLPRRAPRETIEKKPIIREDGPRDRNSF